jgi:hypothetical protein
MIWDEMAAGMSFGVVCEMLAFRADPDSAPVRAATQLHGWITTGLLSDMK